MTRVFDIDCLPEVPRPGRHAVLLTARVDLDLATEAAARSQIGRIVRQPAAAVLLDLTDVFVGVAVLRCIRDIAGSRDGAGPTVVTVGAPSWLTAVEPLLGLPPVQAADTVDAAVKALCADYD
jgi:hypothetical protein